MKLIGGLIAAAAVLVAATLLGGWIGLVIGGIAVVVLAAAVTAARLPSNETVPNVETADPSTVEASAPYRRLAMATTWSKGSARDWDYGVRPVLAELTEQAITEQDPAGAGDFSEAGRRLLGDDLWPFVDPAVPLSDDRRAPGPGRNVLVRILDRLEA